jgi:hypothetical protein
MAWVTFFSLWVVLFVFFELSDTRKVNYAVKAALSCAGAIALTLIGWLVIKFLALPTWVSLFLVGIVIVLYFLFRKSPGKASK